MLQVHLKQYKTDQFGKGADIVLGKTGNELCPVAAALGYMAVRGDQPGPFFIDADSRPLRKAQFVTELCAILSNLGWPQEQFAGHSFYIGAATTAALSGVEDSTIQLMGRWHNAAFLRYIRTPSEQLETLSRVLAGQERASAMEKFRRQ